MAERSFIKIWSLGFDEIAWAKGFNLTCPKYPVSAERLADGRGYKFSAENVAAYLKASDG